MEIPKIPEEFISEKKSKKSSLTKTAPRRWTSEELQWCKDRKDEGHTYKQIAEALGRSEVSVGLKMKRMTKKDDTYNEKHLEEKYRDNAEFFREINPNTVIDAFCGEKSYYRTNHPDVNVITNDNNTDILADYHLDYIKFMALMLYEGNKVDLVDLDPFGSAYPALPMAIMLAKKGLVVTLGEMGHRRWKRLDYVSRVYGITSLEEFTADNIAQSIVKMAEAYKVKLTVHSIKEYRNISRVFFTVSELSEGIKVGNNS